MKKIITKKQEQAGEGNSHGLMYKPKMAAMTLNCSSPKVLYEGEPVTSSLCIQCP